MASPPERRRAARHQHPSADGSNTEFDSTRPEASAVRKKPITVDAIVSTAFGIVAREGFDALTMRRVANELGTGPASLYAHVVNKADLDELLIGRLCAEIDLPQPNSPRWREQIVDVCVQLRDVYLKYPGISRAALAVAPTDVETLRVSEGMLAILLAGGVTPQVAAWAIDALLLYVNAYCLERSTMEQRKVGDGANWVVDSAELRSRLSALPAETFPQTTRYASELTAGVGHDRFDFTIALMIDGLLTA